MEWTKIDYDGIEVLAADFCGGVLITLEGELPPAYIPGYYVGKQRGDMAGPALRPMAKPPLKLAVKLVEDE